MTRWLRNRDGERARHQARRDAADYVPRSVRPPEAQRLAPADLDVPAEGEPDADLLLLESLAAEAGDVAGPTADAPAGRRPGADDLRLFHESRLLPSRRVLPAVALAPDVEIADLLEDLSTTAAALRRLRKAA